MKKKVVIQLKDVVFPLKYVSDNGEHLSDKEILQLAQSQLKEMMYEQVEKLKAEKMRAINENTEKKVLKQNNENKFTYKPIKLQEPNSLFDDEIKPGLIVKTISNEFGIVTGVQRREEKNKHIAVVLPGHRIWYYFAHELMKTNIPFDFVRSYRGQFFQDEKIWHEGDTGYIRYLNNWVPVVIGKNKRGYLHVHTCGNMHSDIQSFQITHRWAMKNLVDFVSKDGVKNTADNDELMEVFRTYNEKIKITRNEQIVIMQKLLFHQQPTFIEHLRKHDHEFIDFHNNLSLSMYEKLSAPSLKATKIQPLKITLPFLNEHNLVYAPITKAEVIEMEFESKPQSTEKKLHVQAPYSLQKRRVSI